MSEYIPDLLGIAGSGGGALVLRRLFGGSVSAVGDAITRLTEYRVRNVGRVVENADSKTEGDGSIPARLALRVLEEAGNSSEDIVVEYLGGLLASSRSPSGGTDAALPYQAVIARLPADALRLHYFLYTSLRAAIRPDHHNLNPYNTSELRAIQAAVPWGVGVHPTDPVVWSYYGSPGLIHRLSEERLISSPWGTLGYPQSPTIDLPGLGPDEEAMMFTPSLRGIELYLYGVGLGARPAHIYFMSNTPMLQQPPFPVHRVAAIPGGEHWWCQDPSWDPPA